MRSATRPEGRRNTKRAAPLPQPGRKKKDPRELDKLLDEGVKESMIASDPPAVAQPEVHTEPGREANVGTDGKKGSRNKA
jgi:hypothetical protein